jgi:hypothetical protein
MRSARLALAVAMLAVGARASTQPDGSSGSLRLTFERPTSRLARSLPPDVDSWKYYITVPDNDREDVRDPDEVARYILPREGGDDDACRLRSRKNYVGLFRLVHPEFASARRVSWKWSVASHPHGGKIGGTPNDQSIQVYLLFREKPEGGDYSYTALSYVWTDKTTELQQRMRGRMPWNNSPRAEMILLALRNGPIAGELAEAVDLQDGYLRAFGRPAPPLWGVVLLADSNEVEPDVGRMTTDAVIRDIRFDK